MVFFSTYSEKYEVIAEKPFPNTGVTNVRVAFSVRHSCRTEHKSKINIIYHAYHKHTRKLNYITPLTPSTPTIYSRGTKSASKSAVLGLTPTIVVYCNQSCLVAPFVGLLP